MIRFPKVKEQYIAVIISFRRSGAEKCERYRLRSSQKKERLPVAEKIMRKLWLIVIFIASAIRNHALTVGQQSYSRNQASLLYQSAVEAVNRNDFAASLPLLRDAIALDPQSFQANQLLGTILTKLAKPEEGSLYLERAVELSEWKIPAIIANYIESLRISRDLNRARDVCVKALDIHPNEGQVVYNAGFTARDLRDFVSAYQLFRRVVEIDPTNKQAWEEAADAAINGLLYTDAEALLSAAVTYFPDDFFLRYLLAVSKHHQKKFEAALTDYMWADRLKPDDYLVHSNLGAVYQSLGRSDEAEAAYQKCMPFRPHDAGIRNNYGALLGTIGRKDDEVKYLLEALEIDPNMDNALVNLGGYYQDDGILEKAKEYFTRALPVSNSPDILKLRIALMLSPVSSSWENMIQERIAVEAALLEIMRSPVRPKKSDLDSSLDRIHFYLVYHCLNDRYMQELIVRSYADHIANLFFILPSVLNNPSLSALQEELRPSRGIEVGNTISSSSGSDSLSGSGLINNAAAEKQTRRVRIAFMSKFFGIFEPHGLLLDGIMRYLPRAQFEVIALPVARTDGKPIAPSVLEAADFVYETSLSHQHVFELVNSLNIDVLVFADTMSEPMTHFMAHSRLAKIQVAFWGNPITSGSASIDYFVSADVMEHPFRTRMPVSDEPYTEQVILMEGQGIWYYTPQPPEVEIRKAGLPIERLGPNTVYTRGDFGLQEDWFLYFCPQSVFKMHPLYDSIFAEILRGNPRGHIFITGGRRPLWTKTYMDRLELALGPELWPRLHMIERVSSEKFLALLRIADVILHPFPFDGSRTSADGLIAGVPVLTLPSEYLRGRMGAAFFRTMNLPELVARSKSEYVRMAVELSYNTTLYQSVKEKIKSRLHLIWEDMEYAHSWAQFLSTAVGLSPLNWGEYILQAGRNLTTETALRDERRRNREEFERAWGPESWLLNDGVAFLESHLNVTQVPRIFNDWKSQVQRGGIDPHPAVNALGIGGGSESTEDGSSTTDGTIAGTTATATAAVETLQRQGRTNSTSRIIIDTGIAYTSIRPYVVTVLPPRSTSGQPVQQDATEAAVEEYKQFVYADEDTEVFEQIRRLAVTGRVEESITLANSMLSSGKYDSHPLFLLEYGAIQYFRGEYQLAFDYCSRAAQIAPDALLIQGCIGCAGIYLPHTKDAALDAFIKAWQLRDAPNPVQSRIFSLTPEALESNLIMALKTYRSKQQCLDFATVVLDLPPVEQGGAYIILFSAVDWSQYRIPELKALAEELTNRGEMQLKPGRSFVSEIRRLQQEARHILNPTLECLTGRSEGVELTNRIINSLVSTVAMSDIDESRLQSFATTASQGKGIVLISQYFVPANNPVLKNDLDNALSLNLANPAISEIHLLTEEEYDLSLFPSNDKIVRQVVIGRRLSFADAFEYANRNLSGRTVALVNADIYFDNSLLRFGDVDTLDLQGEVLALLKWTDERNSGSVSLHIRTDSQDAWIFQPPLAEKVIRESNFSMGISRCDNRIAEILVSSGHAVSNPVFAIHAIELQNTARPSHLYGTKGAPFGPTRDVLLSDRHLF